MRTRLGMLAIITLTALPALLGFFPSTARADVIHPVVVSQAHADGCWYRGHYRHAWYPRWVPYHRYGYRRW